MSCELALASKAAVQKGSQQVHSILNVQIRRPLVMQSPLEYRVAWALLLHAYSVIRIKAGTLGATL